MDNFSIHIFPVKLRRTALLQHENLSKGGGCLQGEFLFVERADVGGRRRSGDEPVYHRQNHWLKIHTPSYKAFKHKL